MCGRELPGPAPRSLCLAMASQPAAAVPGSPAGPGSPSGVGGGAALSMMLPQAWGRMGSRPPPRAARGPRAGRAGSREDLACFVLRLKKRARLFDAQTRRRAPSLLPPLLDSSHQYLSAGKCGVCGTTPPGPPGASPVCPTPPGPINEGCANRKKYIRIEKHF